MGSSWMLLAGASFALMGVWVKLGAQWFSSQELVFYRSAFALLGVLGLIVLSGGAGALGRVSGPYLVLHLRRGVVGFLALSTYFHSLSLLPMSVAVTLNYTSPLFLTLFMPLWLKERIRPVQYAAVSLGFAGVVLLLRPWEVRADLVAGLMGLTSGLLAGVAYVHVRTLGRLQEPEWRTVFWFSAVSAAGAALFSSIEGWNADPLPHWPLLLALGLSATLGQLAMTRAYRRGRTAVVAAFAYSTVVFSSLLDVLIWKEEIVASAWAGMALTVAAGIWAATLNIPTENTT